MRAARRIVERGPIGDKNIVKTIAIVIKNGSAVTRGFENVFLVCASAVSIGYRETGRRRDIDEVDRDCIEGEYSRQKNKCGYPASDP